MTPPRIGTFPKNRPFCQGHPSLIIIIALIKFHSHHLCRNSHLGCHRPGPFQPIIIAITIIIIIIIIVVNTIIVIVCKNRLDFLAPLLKVNVLSFLSWTNKSTAVHRVLIITIIFLQQQIHFGKCALQDIFAYFVSYFPSKNTFFSKQFCYQLNKTLRLAIKAPISILQGSKKQKSSTLENEENSPDSG